MIRILLGGAFSLLLTCVCALAMPWDVDHATSELKVKGTFFLSFTGDPKPYVVEGVFKAWYADITFDPSDLAASKIIASIDMTSLVTGVPERDKELRTPPWFDPAAHPRATFESAQIIAKEDGSYEAVGKLTIRGIAKDITLPFTLQIDGNKALASGSISLKRSDFTVGTDTAPEQVADEVVVSFIINATALTN